MEGGHSRNRGGVCPSGDSGDREGPGLLGTQDRGLAPAETEQDNSVPGSYLAGQWLGGRDSVSGWGTEIPQAAGIALPPPK